MSASLHGFGLGLRPEHYRDVIDRGAQRPLDWLELISENYMVPGGKPLANVERIRRDYPVAMHGVSLSIGSVDALDLRYLDALKSLVDRLEPAWVSDHLCWTGVDHTNLHDLLPLPYTQAALAHVASRVQQVQERLGRPLMLENVSSYVRFAGDEMSEPQFIAELARRTGCWLLLDVNNVYVSAHNHGFDAHAFIDAMPAAQVRQIHLAGHEDRGGLLVDTHDHPVRDEVWSLYAHALRRLGPVPTMIERDDDIPPFDELLAELDIARRIAAEVEAEPVAAAA
jgi:hypothetical protein